MKAATMKELYEARELAMQAVSELCKENNPDISAFQYRIGFTEGLTLAIDILSKEGETNV